MPAADKPIRLINSDSDTLRIEPSAATLCAQGWFRFIRSKLLIAPTYATANTFFYRIGELSGRVLRMRGEES